MDLNSKSFPARDFLTLPLRQRCPPMLNSSFSATCPVCSLVHHAPDRSSVQVCLCTRAQGMLFQRFLAQIPFTLTFLCNISSSVQSFSLLPLLFFLSHLNIPSLTDSESFSPSSLLLWIYPKRTSLSCPYQSVFSPLSSPG